MSFIRKYGFLFLLGVCGFNPVFAQLEFNMSDTLVTECKGILYDDGGDGVNYFHNADEIFTICLDAPGTLNLAFDFLCIELGSDSLMFHAGSSILDPQIGPAYSGTIPPPVHTINSGCITLHFVSDANVACTGWEAHWTTQIVPPVPPQIAAIIPVPACSSTTAIINLSKNIACDSVYAAAFELIGPLTVPILSASPISCTNDSTQQVQVTFASGIDLGGNYQIEFTTHYWDACDSLWTFTTSDNFSVFDCPIVVTLTPQNDSICFGDCTIIDIEVTGGDGNYTYSWNTGMSYTGPAQTVCPLNDITYTLTVDDTSPALASSGSTSITVFQPATVPAPSSHCQSDAPFDLSASPTGGWWIGSGITDSLAGTFNGDSAVLGLNQPGYYLPITPSFGCTTLTNITIIPINAGIAQAACPGSAPFQIIGFTPLGGTWSGPSVSPSGVFDPVAAGVYTVTYSVNGCSEDMTIYVDDISNLPVLTDTLCQSAASILYALNPPGGRWTGEGIIDSLTGLFDPGETDAGLIPITYNLNGCSQTIEVYVKEIFAGWDQTACPSQDTFLLADFSPIGGTWSGTGIVDSLLGIFEPGTNTNQNFTTDLIYSHPNGCTDTTTIYVVYSRIDRDTIVFCSGDQGIILDHFSMETSPWSGNWSGNGVIPGADQDSSFFDPALAGTGVHLLTFDINTCVDTAYMIVQKAFLPDIPLTCEQAPAFQITVPDYALGGTFSGDGIIDPIGMFSPSDAGTGSHEIYYESPQGCLDTLTAEIDSYQEASIDGPAGILCYTDSLYSVSVQPLDALYYGTGSVLPGSFNPILSGEGDHWLYAETGQGYCRSIDSVMVSVGPAIGYSLVVSTDSICYGDYVSMQANAFGGNGNLITYSWNQGLQPLQQQVVSPLVSTQYTLEISDGCSRLRDTVDIEVSDPINYSISTSDSLCYGRPGFAQIDGGHSGSYQVVWDNELYITGEQLPGLASNTYSVSIRDTISGCSVDTLITIPGYPLVKAQFSVNPEYDCIPEEIKDINFIDLSSGALQGSWNFGDGTVIPYVSGENPTHSYPIYGEYVVGLEVADSNGCSDKTDRTICLKEPFKVYLPNAFTINEDGLNEVFLAKGTGILTFHMWVYERSGKVLFESDALDKGWDGKLNGRIVPMGVYGWIVEVQWTDKQWFTTAGTVTLIR